MWSCRLPVAFIRSRRRATTAVVLSRFQRVSRFFMCAVITSTTARSRHSTANGIAMFVPLLVVAEPTLLRLPMKKVLVESVWTAYNDRCYRCLCIAERVAR